jgi:hypothetical protein
MSAPTFWSRWVEDTVAIRRRPCPIVGAAAVRTAENMCLVSGMARRQQYALEDMVVEMLLISMAVAWNDFG